jgi:heme/copper-type cytochrome/quinol oxidase subunit 3
MMLAGLLLIPTAVVGGSLIVSVRPEADRLGGNNDVASGGLVLVVLGILLVLFGLFGFIAAAIANMAAAKGRSWSAFFWLTIVFGPLIMWIIAASISANSGPTAHSGSPTTRTDSLDQLSRLSQLHQEGLLTKEEFEAKKKDLLGRV